MDFGYRCQECGKGTVLKTVMAQYRTKVNGQPFMVEHARGRRLQPVRRRTF